MYMYVYTYVYTIMYYMITFCTAELHSLHDKTKTFFALCRKDKTALREHQYIQLCQVLYINLIKHKIQD